MFVSRQFTWPAWLMRVWKTRRKGKRYTNRLWTKSEATTTTPVWWDRAGFLSDRRQSQDRLWWTENRSGWLLGSFMDEVIVVCYSGDQRPALNWSTKLVLVAALVKELSTYSAHELQRRAAELEDGRVKEGALKWTKKAKTNNNNNNSSFPSSRRRKVKVVAKTWRRGGVDKAMKQESCGACVPMVLIGIAYNDDWPFHTRLLHPITTQCSARADGQSVTKIIT